MIINVHGGHTKASGKSCGAVGLLNESNEDRKVCKEVVRLLKEKGHTVYNCTAEGENERDNLYKIVAKCNKHKANLDISIHFNSGAKDKGKGDGKSCGTECWVSSGGLAIKRKTAKQIVSNLSKLGFTNRGVKTSNGLYVLNHTTAPAVLVEVCFVDDREDYEIYKKVGYKNVAEAIVKGVLK